MPRLRLIKPTRSSAEAVELYHSESMTIDSTATAIEACGNCHDFSAIHNHDRVSANAGIGVSLPNASGSASINTDGHLSLNLTVGNGITLGVMSTHVPNTGPHISTGGRSVTLSGSGSNTSTSAAQDNTRVGR